LLFSFHRGKRVGGHHGRNHGKSEQPNGNS
jgi:hypothetical protein